MDEKKYTIEFKRKIFNNKLVSTHTKHIATVNISNLPMNDIKKELEISNKDVDAAIFVIGLN